MSSSEATQPIRRQINARRVVSSDVETSYESVVVCPKSAGTVDFQACTRCAQYAGLAHDRAQGHSFVLCRTPDVALDEGKLQRAVIGEIMTSDVLCLREELDLTAARELLLHEGVNSAPVVDATRAPIGMLSRSDLLRPRPAGTLVADVMTPMAFFVHARASIGEAASLMAYEGVHQVPVVSDDEKVIGLVTALDVLRWQARRSGELPKKEERHAEPEVPVALAATERLRSAFHFIEAERLKVPALSLEDRIERARCLYELTPAQLTWVRWTLAPDSIALQAKQPDASDDV